MLYIEKGSPPGEMLRKVSEIKSSPEWKQIKNGDTKAVRSMFDLLPKDNIRQSLLKEQHFLCAYCMRSIENDGNTTTIEHWAPLSTDKEGALDYKNMLAVCDGGKKWKGGGKKILCCDACKSDEDKMKISPLNRSQMEKIAYSKDGFIKTEPSDVELEMDIRDKLCLNGIWKNGRFIADTSTNLVKERKNQYEIYKRLIKSWAKEGKCTSAQVKKKIDKLEKAEQRDAYVGVLLYFLNKKYRVLLGQGK